jgi:endonuclease/exonuclease/phosphatase family metal-dependent hydrolase
VAYRSNAVTRHGEHGNALLSRWPLGDIGHHDVSDHRFEQRGLLHVPVAWNGSDRARRRGALRAGARSRVRQVQRLAASSSSEVPAGEMLVVAGDFNDWGEKLDAPMAETRPGACQSPDAGAGAQPDLPVADAGVRARPLLPARAGLRSTMVPRGMAWARMSDHLPLVAELEPA